MKTRNRCTDKIINNLFTYIKKNIDLDLNRINYTSDTNLLNKRDHNYILYTVLNGISEYTKEKSHKHFKLLKGKK